MIAHYAAKGTLHAVDGDGTAEAVFEEIRKVLDGTLGRAEKARE